MIKETTASSEPEELERALRSLSGTVSGIGLEAGPLSQWLYLRLTEADFDTILMETQQVKGALKAMPIKTDSRDDPAGVSIVIMLRSLKLYGMANAVEDLGAQGAPDTLEQPQHRLDAVFSQQLGQHFSLKAKAQNLLGAERILKQGPETTLEAPIGRSFSIGLNARF